MRLLELTLPNPAANIALDEALLETAEQQPEPWEVLRLWEAPRPLVVVGRSSRVAEEVDQLACQRLDVPILRRCSGGAAVVAGPGCLMYAVVLSYELRPQLKMIDHAHQFVLARLVAGLSPHFPAVRAQGISDLTCHNRKISGNSLRCKRRHLLYHGTLLYDFPLAQIEQLLRTPPRQPDYRAGRGHGQFVANLPAPADLLRASLPKAFEAAEPLDAWPQALTAELVATRYAQPAWNLRL